MGAKARKTIKEKGHSHAACERCEVNAAQVRVSVTDLAGTVLDLKIFCGECAALELPDFQLGEEVM